MRERRANVTPKLLHPVTPTVKPKIPGLKMDGNRILGLADVQPIIPVWSPCEHYEPGDKVLVRRGKRMIETVIPEIDADGNPMPD